MKLLESDTNIQKNDFMKHIFTFNRVLLILICIGIVLRIGMLWARLPVYDGTTYMAVGHSLSQNHAFIEPWGEFTSWDASEPAYSKVAPLFPTYLAVFYKLFGFSIPVTQLANLILSMLCLFIIYLTTRDLFGHQKGLVVTAVMAFVSTLVWATGASHTENLLMLVFTLLIWALLKSLKESRYVILMGVFLAFFYLIKSHSLDILSVIICFMCFVAWRYLYEGATIFRDKNYLLGFGAFFGIAGTWALRNYLRLGDYGSVSSGNNSLFLSSDLLVNLLWTIIMVVVCFVVYWLPELKKSLGKIKIEDYNILWLVAIGYTLLVWISTSGVEAVHLQGQGLRYIFPVFIVILWLVLKETDFQQRISGTSASIKGHIKSLLNDKERISMIITVLIISVIVLFFFPYNWLVIYLLFGAFSLTLISPRKRLAIMLLALLLVSANTATFCVQLPDVEAANDLNARIQNGDLIAVYGYPDGTMPYKYNLYPYLWRHDTNPFKYYDGCNATYVLSYTNRSFEGYNQIGEYYWESKLGIIVKSKIFFRESIKRIFFGERIARGERTPSAWLWKKSNYSR